MARWVPTSPEYEAKTLFGRHLWCLAQHADELGKRTAELRLGLHANRAPVPTYQSVLDDVAGRVESPDRIAGMYDAVLPDLRRRYQQYIESVDPLMDEPTVHIAERAALDLQRLLRERDEVISERADLGAAADTALFDQLRAIEAFVDFRPDRGPGESDRG